ncbi:sugar ABC transporter substrate-binding protein [Lysobacter sp. CFH 32150]|uniref:sugar ABC transporter substrate-binding protein n=1 Tax=Lysobacter sp. CFH 32150 TaxID=2927128 RepID=UPI001FA7522C|nr:sugar ABC transporter substrate-binding protein [Lysobacter sp. CFH 32150]MCI4567165.1 sugar ABC transporter substrate-binding protein [Lysobacter sp. CFH 32150]
MRSRSPLPWLCCLLLALCGGCMRERDDGKEVVRFWAMGYEGEVVAQLIPEFERRNPGIKVDLQQLPWLSAHEKLLTGFAGDALPDVVPLGNTWIAEFAALDALEPLDPFIARTPSLDTADYFPGPWDSGVVDGNVYAVPWYVETRLPFYRTDLLKKAGVSAPPKSWDEWRTAMAAIKREVGPDNYAILLPLNEFEPLLNLAIQEPEPLLRDDGRYGNFRSAGFRHALGFYKEMFDKRWAPLATNVQISNVWDELGNGFFSFYISGPWNIAKFKERLPQDQQDDWMTMPLPGPNGAGASVAGGTSLVIFRQSRHKQAAWKLIEYLSEPGTQARFHALTGNLPPRRSPWRTPALGNDPHARAFRIQLERAVSTPKVPEWERIATEMRLVGEQVANGRMTVDEAAVELDRRADSILEKRRWMLDHHTLSAGAQ